MSHDIVVFSVTTSLTKTIKRVLADMGESFRVYEEDLFNVLPLVEAEVKAGARVIISRGGTADLIRKHFTPPVVEIHHDYFGVHKVVQQALEVSDKIATVAFPLYAEIMQNYSEMCGIPIFTRVIRESGEIEEALEELQARGIRVVIGGLSVARMAKRFGIAAIMGDADEMAIRLAVEQARHTLKYVLNLDRQYNIVSAILNCANEGILGVDGSGTIFELNHHAHRLLGCGRGDNINTILPESDSRIAITNGEPIRSRIVNSGKATLIFNASPIDYGENGGGTVLTVQEGDYIQGISQKIRQQHIAKGHVARIRFEDIVGKGEAIHHTIERAKKFALSESSVLIIGETGTGKELFAQSIHNHSRRHSKPFVAINCAALPNNVLESELFGYVRGAFTGAKDAGKSGIFELAHGGSVFLDEIGEIPIEMQAKLLRVIQERQVQRIGDDKLVPVDVRVISATNKNVDNEVKLGRFREDLYFRLNTLELELPPLRERTGDVPTLIRHFMGRAGRREVSFTPDAQRFLNVYSWPGNVRQLGNFIERLNVLYDQPSMSLSEVCDLLGTAAGASVQGAAQQRPSTLAPDDENVLEKMERDLIAEALDITTGNREKASIILGISPSTLGRKKKQYGL
ncbi:sigma 54-interacting transcriptional regulator [Rhodopseudomonas palustris]|uniref:Sigma-54 factor, interaction region n=1 Tax=Rhodopseudomonas palustris (strain BisB18) TaxID=316056 RepID=Q214B6_RHOPB